MELNIQQEAERETAPETQETAPEETADKGDTTPPEVKEIFIPIKFNKQTKNLTAEQAAGFAQKGMKYDMIAADYERLRNLAAGQGMGVGAYIGRLEEKGRQTRRNELLQKCGGDEELAGHILDLEQKTGGSADSFEELRGFFPEIKEPSELPEEVTERAALRGTALLDEYLRYRLSTERRCAETEAAMKAAGKAAVGSQRQAAPPETAVNSEFLKGLWGR